jgi:hypothetical protein
MVQLDRPGLNAHQQRMLLGIAPTAQRIAVKRAAKRELRRLREQAARLELWIERQK